MKTQTPAIGYLNHNPYPVQIMTSHGPVQIRAGDPVVDDRNLLVPCPNPSLDEAVAQGIISEISSHNPRFKDWNKTAEKFARIQPLPKGADQHPVRSEAEDHRPIKTRHDEDEAGQAGVSRSVTIDPQRGPIASTDSRIPTDLSNPVLLQEALSHANLVFNGGSTVSYDGQEFASYQAFRNYCEKKASKG